MSVSYFGCKQNDEYFCICHRLNESEHGVSFLLREFRLYFASYVLCIHIYRHCGHHPALCLSIDVYRRTSEMLLTRLSVPVVPSYHRGRVYIIDVSQSLEHDHQNSLHFLRKDCTNITSKTEGRGLHQYHQ